MDTGKTVEAFKALQKKLKNYNYAMGVISVDGDTAAPSGSYAERGEVLGMLTEAYLGIYLSEDTERLLESLEEIKDELDSVTRKEYEHFSKLFYKEKKIPVEEQVAFSTLVNEAGAIWHQAKEENNFELFRPYLEKLVENQRRFAGYYASDKAPYDVWLDEFEPGMNMEKTDAFFDAIKEPLISLVKKISESRVKIDASFLHQNYPKAEQAKWSEYLMEVLQMDKRYSSLGETEHPFTAGFSKHDVRITTHYYEDDVASSMFSVLHEGGHGIYELGIGDDIKDGCLSGGTSSAVHESQSRFFENYIGRSREFIYAVYPKMQEIFSEQLKNVTAEQMYLAVNEAKPSLIRTEADELTYAIHILIRYEIEKKLLAGETEVKDLPALWNRMYKEYLGVDVPDDRQGVLQDSHWSGGMFGYFPTYAIGSAYGAQLLAKMKETVDVEACVSKADLGPIKEWLGARIHEKGWMLDPGDVIKACTGQEFNPQYFIDYLTRKYSEIYQLEK